MSKGKKKLKDTAVAKFLLGAGSGIKALGGGHEIRFMAFEEHAASNISISNYFYGVINIYRQYWNRF